MSSGIDQGVISRKILKNLLSESQFRILEDVELFPESFLMERAKRLGYKSVSSVFWTIDRLEDKKLLWKTGVGNGAKISLRIRIDK